MSARPYYDRASAALDAAHKACMKTNDSPIGMSHGAFSGVNEALGIVAILERHLATAKARLSELEAVTLERAAEVAERDVDWTAFSRSSKKDWKTGDENNLFAAPNEPDETMPTDFNVFAYRIGIAAGRSISAAIRALKGGAR